MELKGFDSFNISLGDEMRGERASLGKSLEDAERELRIKAKMITAIEDCELTGFANQSVIAGYVRSYARYLGMDAEDCYNRFCEESGYQSPAAMMSTSGDGSGFGSLQQAPITSGVGTEIGKSRFAAPPSTNRFKARISLGALTSSLALVGLICGLAYGGYALLQDIQRVGIAPLPDAPVVVADAPSIGAPQIDQREVARPSASDYQGGGTLVAVTRNVDLPPLQQPRRDGPISAIDPSRAGIFASVQQPEPMPFELDGVVPIAPPDSELMMESPDAVVAFEEPQERGIVLHAAATAWIRVREHDKSIIWQGTLKAGEQFRLPEQVVEPTLRSGDAGATFIIVDGVPYGPIGKSGQLAKNVSLLAEDVRTNVPPAEDATIEANNQPSIEVRAEARVTQP